MQQATMQAISELRKDTGRDIADLRERIARLEGLFEGYAQQAHDLSRASDAPVAGLAIH